jgi:hypothetical protein
MEVRGGGTAGAGPLTPIAAGARKLIGAPVSPATGEDSARRAPSKAFGGTGTAVLSGASSRQPDHDGTDEGSVSISPWQSPASQQAIFTGQWQPCFSAEGAATLASAARGRSSDAAKTATSAPAHRRDLLFRMTGSF